MKPTLTINLNSIVFHIDNDAYESLSAYLDEIKSHFEPEEQNEIMSDIEARIAELFSEKISNHKHVINIDDVTNIMGILGSPNQFTDESDTETQSSETSKKERRKNRKYYRNPDNAMLGGVVSGLAAYLGWDVVILRIAVCIITIFAFGWLGAIYFVVWLVTPEARSTAQKLEMQGEEPTLENIKNYVNSEQFKESITNVGNKFTQIFRPLLKIAFLFVGIIIAFLGIAFICLVIVTTIAAIYCFATEGMSEFLPMSPIFENFSSPFVAYSLIASLFIAITFPILWIIVGVSNQLFRQNKEKHSPLWLKITSFVLWIICSIYFATMFTIIGLDRAKSYKMSNSDFHSSEIVTLRQEIGEYDAIDICAAVNLTIEKGDSSHIVYSGDKGALSNFKFRNDNGTLKLYRQGSTRGFDDVNVTIYKTNINEIEASAACTVTTRDTILANDISLDASAASKLDLNIVAKNISCEASAASKINLHAIAETIDCDASAASKITVSGRCTSLETETSAASKSLFTNLEYENIDSECDISSRILIIK